MDLQNKGVRFKVQENNKLIDEIIAKVNAWKLEELKRKEAEQEKIDKEKKAGK